jgi:hypothetical protein
MAFRIVYFRKDERVGVVPSPTSLDDAHAAARKGLVQLDADRADILDMDKKAVVVGTVTRQGPCG